MIVVVGIISLISSVLIFNYSDFRTNVSIRNLTQDIALSLRKAQTYATSVQSLGDGSSSEDFPSYGMSFSPSQTQGAEFIPYNKKFVLFADIPVSNQKYDSTGVLCGTPSATDECVEAISITTPDKIVAICTDSTGAEVCSSTGLLDVTFQRPSPDAIICYRAGGYGDSCAPGAASYAKVVLQSAAGISRNILIWNTGQIAIQ